MNQTNYTLFLPFFLLQREKKGWVGEWAFSLVSCLSSGENNVKALSMNYLCKTFKWIFGFGKNNGFLFVLCPWKSTQQMGYGVWNCCCHIQCSCYAYWFSPNTTHFSHLVIFKNPSQWKSSKRSPLWFFEFALWLWTVYGMLFCAFYWTAQIDRKSRRETELRLLW